ncbi:MAG: tetratricopeptide repeat protein [Magnetococcales bacterium]|nr:tetratricopeptide repeat protein [Magnetococcales bacterium]
MGHGPRMWVRLGLVIGMLAGAGLSGCDSKTGDDQTAQETGDAAPEQGMTEGAAVAVDQRQSPEDFQRAALAQRSAGMESQAIDTLNTALGLHPDHAGLLSLRGSLHLEQGRPAVALTDLNAAAARQPDHPPTLINRAQAQKQLNNVTQALTDLDRVVAKHPDLMPARFNRGAIHFEQKRFKEALADFDHAIVLDPNTPALYYNRALTLDALGERNGARADLERLLAMNADEALQQQARDRLEQWGDGNRSGGQEKSKEANRPR